MKRIAALLLTAIFVFSLGANALAEMGGPGGGPGGPGGEPGGHGGGPDGAPGMQESDVAGTGNAVNTEGMISVVNGEATADDLIADCVSQNGEETVIEELNLVSGDYGTTVISTSGSTVSVRNSSIEMNVDAEVESDAQAGTALYTDSGTTILEDSEITVNGAGRYTVAATGTATLAVRDCVITAGGDNGAEGNTSSISEPASNAGLLISGTSRANFSVGQTHTFYYDSLCAADGWATLSTDSATGSGLEFVAVYTEALALHGGYGISSDTSCRDYLYGCTLVSAEVGAIISNNGSITVDSSENAAAAVTQDGYEALAYAGEDDTADSGRSVIIAGRNDFQLHSPDMMGDGTSDYTASLTLNHTDLVTDDSVNGEGYIFTSSVNGEEYLIQADTDYAEKYGEAVGAYVDYVSGAAILVKSTSADIRLNDVTVSSSSGTAVLTALNSDSMSRYLKKDIGEGVHVSVEDSVIDGDFVHDDYQRDMAVTLDASTLNGAVTYCTAEQWNEYWAACASDEACCWADLDASVYVTDTHETVLTLTNGSVWNVTGASLLTQLSVTADSAVNGSITAERTETLEDGTTVYYHASVSCIE